MPEFLNEVVLDQVAAWEEAPPNAWELMTAAVNLLGRFRSEAQPGEVDHANAVFEAFLERGWIDPPPDARYEGPLEEALLGCPDVAIRLVERGASLRNSRGNALAWCMSGRTFEALDAILARMSLEPDEATSERWHWACSEYVRHAPVASALLRILGPNGRGHAGLTPLFYAAMQLDRAGVDQLLAAGADPTARTTAAVKVLPFRYPGNGQMPLPKKSSVVDLLAKWRVKVANPAIVELEAHLAQAASGAERAPSASPPANPLSLAALTTEAAWEAFAEATQREDPKKVASAVKKQLSSQHVLTLARLLERRILPEQAASIVLRYLDNNVVPPEVKEVVRAVRVADSERTSAMSLGELVATSRGAKTLITTLRRAQDGEAIEGASRVGGTLPGLSAGRWPTRVRAPMKLVLVLSRTDAPTLSSPGIAVFAHAPHHNGAMRPSTDETAVLPLTAQELASSAGGTPIVAERIEVPANLWSSRTLSSARSKLLSFPGFAGGKPLWLQRAEHSGAFVLQADAQLLPMNLGDTGILYVFEDTAFWQCL